MCYNYVALTEVLARFLQATSSWAPTTKNYHIFLIIHNHVAIVYNWDSTQIYPEKIFEWLL
jgi:hypothetical protein